MAFAEVLIAVVLISPQQAGTRGNLSLSLSLSSLSISLSLSLPPSLSFSPVTLNEQCAVSGGRQGLYTDWHSIKWGGSSARIEKGRKGDRIWINWRCYLLERIHPVNPHCTPPLPPYRSPSKSQPASGGGFNQVWLKRGFFFLSSFWEEFFAIFDFCFALTEVFTLPQCYSQSPVRFLMNESTTWMTRCHCKLKE